MLRKKINDLIVIREMCKFPESSLHQRGDTFVSLPDRWRSIDFTHPTSQDIAAAKGRGLPLHKKGITSETFSLFY